MTFADLLNEVAAQAGDDGAAFRTQARRWLNYVRADIADLGDWRTAFNADVELTTSSATTSGLYVTTGYERISGKYLYDETNEMPLASQSFSEMQARDPDKSVTGNPQFWADAGVDSNDNRQIYLWPIPDGTYTIRYAAYKVLTEISESDETLTTDPYFGDIVPWAATFFAGLRYYMSVDDNEDIAQSELQERKFHKKIRQRLKKNSVSPHAAQQMAAIRSYRHVTAGRLDPTHFENS